MKNRRENLRVKLKHPFLITNNTAPTNIDKYPQAKKSAKSFDSETPCLSVYFHICCCQL